ncbi:MAG: ABC transporter ATP-binding protein [Limnothrix sp.]
MLQKLKILLKSPAYQLILQTAIKNRLILASNIITNLLGIILEGSTLGVIYAAIAFLSEGPASFDKIPVFGSLPENFGFDEKYLFILLMISAVVLQGLLALSKYGNNISTAFLSAKVQPQVTGTVFRQIMSLSFSCASKYKVGDLVFFANRAAQTVDMQIKTFNGLALSISFTLIYSLILLKLSSLLASIAVVLALLIAFIQRFLLPRLRKEARALVAVQVRLSEKMTETIQALRLIHTFGTQEKTIRSIDSLLQKTESVLKKRGLLLFFVEPVLDILPIFALAVLASTAYLLNPEDQSLLPSLLTFLIALQRLTVRIRGVSTGINQIIDNGPQIQRLDSILENKDKEFSLLGNKPFDALGTDIEFRDVDLSYANDGFFAIQGFNLTLPKNKVTAFVGQSGAGKSSLVDMLIGLYKPTNGDVIANNESIYNFYQADWRREIGVVSQDTVVFNTSILENLKYGAPDISFEEVVEITKATQAHQFILDLPDGYDTTVGERGYRLSGGQRQRLALARALVKNPDILILDEATSALDSQSEKLIQEALDKFQENRTVIVIAHRLSTIVGADQIVVLENGKVIEKGNHQSLVAQNGQYAKAWALQVGK